MPAAVVAAATGLTVGVLDFAGVVVGRVPLPMWAVEQFPAWSGVPGRVPIARTEEMGDLVTQEYPWHRFTAGAVRGGHLPLWQPHQMAGYPWVANLQSGVFSPTTIPFYVLSLPTAWALMFPVRVALAVVCMTLFCRRLGARTGPALVGGIGYGAGGFVFLWSGWPHGDAVVWLPAVWLGIDVLSERPSVAGAVATGAAGAAVILPGHPQTMLYAGALAAAFAAFRLYRAADRARFGLACAAAGALAVGLSAVELLPGVEWIQRLQRSPGAVMAARYPLGALTALVSRDVSGPFTAAGVSPPNGGLYLGMLVLIGAAMAWRWRRRDDVIFMAAVAAVGIGVAYGVQPLFWIANHTPGFAGVPNVRMVLLPSLALPVLASLGLTSALDRALDPGRWRAWGVAAGIVLVGVVALAVRVDHLHGRAAPLLGGVAASFAVAVAAALVVAPPILARLRAGPASVVLVVVAAADLVTFGHTAFPLVERSQLYRTPPILTALRRLDADGGRVATVDAAMPDNAALAYGFDGVDGYDLVLRDEATFLAGLGSAETTIGLRSAAVSGAGDRRLDLLNLEFIVTSDVNRSNLPFMARPDRFQLVASADHTEVFRNLRALPRAWLVPAGGAVGTATVRTAVAQVASPSFDPLTVVTVRGRAPAGRDAVPIRAPVTFSEGGDRDVATFDSPSAAIAVISQQWYPGWHATVDGVPARVYEVDGILDGVSVPPGTHRIVLTFQPTSFRVGAAISIASVLAAVIALAWAAATRSRARDREHLAPAALERE